MEYSPFFREERRESYKKEFLYSKLISNLFEIGQTQLKNNVIFNYASCDGRESQHLNFHDFTSANKVILWKIFFRLWSLQNIKYLVLVKRTLCLWYLYFSFPECDLLANMKSYSWIMFLHCHCGFHCKQDTFCPSARKGKVCRVVVSRASRHVDYEGPTAFSRIYL